MKLYDRKDCDVCGSVGTVAVGDLGETFCFACKRHLTQEQAAALEEDIKIEKLCAELKALGAHYRVVSAHGTIFELSASSQRGNKNIAAARRKKGKHRDSRYAARRALFRECGLNDTVSKIPRDSVVRLEKPKGVSLDVYIRAIAGRCHRTVGAGKYSVVKSKDGKAAEVYLGDLEKRVQ